MYMECTNFGFKKANLHKGLCMLHLTGMIMARIKNIYSYTVKGLQMKCTELHSNLPAHNNFFLKTYNFSDLWVFYPVSSIKESYSLFLIVFCMSGAHL